MCTYGRRKKREFCFDFLQLKKDTKVVCDCEWGESKVSLFSCPFVTKSKDAFSCGFCKGCSTL